MEDILDVIGVVQLVGDVGERQGKEGRSSLGQPKAGRLALQDVRLFAGALRGEIVAGVGNEVRLVGSPHALLLA